MPGLKNSESRKDVLPKTIQCKDCGAPFVFTESEQAFYQEKGFDNEPQRCPECRAARKQARNSGRGRDGYYVIALRCVANILTCSILRNTINMSGWAFNL